MRTSAVLVLAAISHVALSQPFRSEEHSFTVTRVISGLAHPWSSAFLPDGNLLTDDPNGFLARLEPAN